MFNEFLTLSEAREWTQEEIDAEVKAWGCSSEKELITLMTDAHECSWDNPEPVIPEKHQPYHKTDLMIRTEEYARSLADFDKIRKVSMAANIVDGHLIVGNRHFCPIMRMQIELLNLDYDNHCINYDQGFIDQWGIYMSRKEAYIVAKQAGQIVEDFGGEILFSESYL